MVLTSKAVHRILSGFLVFSMALQPLVYAAPAPAQGGRTESKTALYRLPVSSSVAAVEEAWTAQQKGSKQIYLLQDAHTNPSAQFNIANLLESLLESDKQIRTVFVEAGFGNDTLSDFRPLTPSAERQRAAAAFLRQGYLGGEEYLSLVSDIDFTIWGVEERSLYDQAVLAYRQTRASRKEFNQYLDNVESTLQMLEGRVLNPVLASFYSKKRAYLSGHLPMTSYLESLETEMAGLGLESKAGGELRKLSAIREAEKRIDFEKARRQQVDAVQSLSQEDRDELVGHDPRRFHLKEEGESAFYLRLNEKLEAAAPNARSLYPDLYQYLEYRASVRALDLNRVIEEIEAAGNSVTEQMILSSDERSFLDARSAADGWRKLFLFTLTPGEYEQYRSLAARYPVVHVLGFLNRKVNESGSNYERALFLPKDFEEVLAVAESFYSLTLKRDEAFIRNMTDRMDEAGLKKAVLITGGYHTANLKSILKNKNISFVSVTPQVLHETNLKRYEELLLGEVWGKGAVLAGQPVTARLIDKPGLADWPQAFAHVGARLAPKATPAELEAMRLQITGARFADQAVRRDTLNVVVEGPAARPGSGVLTGDLAARPGIGVRVQKWPLGPALKKLDLAAWLSNARKSGARLAFHQPALITFTGADIVKLYPVIEADGRQYLVEIDLRQTVIRGDGLGYSPATVSIYADDQKIEVASWEIVRSADGTLTGLGSVMMGEEVSRLYPGFAAALDAVLRPEIGKPFTRANPNLYTGPVDSFLQEPVYVSLSGTFKAEAAKILAGKPGDLDISLSGEATKLTAALNQELRSPQYHDGRKDYPIGRATAEGISSDLNTILLPRGYAAVGAWDDSRQTITLYLGRITSEESFDTEDGPISIKTIRSVSGSPENPPAAVGFAGRRYGIVVEDAIENTDALRQSPLVRSTRNEWIEDEAFTALQSVVAAIIKETASPDQATRVAQVTRRVVNRLAEEIRLYRITFSGKVTNWAKREYELRVLAYLKLIQGGDINLLTSLIRTASTHDRLEAWSVLALLAGASYSEDDFLKGRKPPVKEIAEKLQSQMDDLDGIQRKARSIYTEREREYISRYAITDPLDASERLAQLFNDSTLDRGEQRAVSYLVRVLIRNSHGNVYDSFEEQVLEYAAKVPDASFLTTLLDIAVSGAAADYPAVEGPAARAPQDRIRTLVVAIAKRLESMDGQSENRVTDLLKEIGRAVPLIAQQMTSEDRMVVVAGLGAQMKSRNATDYQRYLGLQALAHIPSQESLELMLSYMSRQYDKLVYEAAEAGLRANSKGAAQLMMERLVRAETPEERLSVAFMLDQIEPLTQRRMHDLYGSAAGGIAGRLLMLMRSQMPSWQEWVQSSLYALNVDEDRRAEMEGVLTALEAFIKSFQSHDHFLRFVSGWQFQNVVSWAQLKSETRRHAISHDLLVVMAHPKVIWQTDTNLQRLHRVRDLQQGQARLSAAYDQIYAQKREDLSDELTGLLLTSSVDIDVSSLKYLLQVIAEHPAESTKLAIFLTAYLKVRDIRILDEHFVEEEISLLLNSGLANEFYIRELIEAVPFTRNNSGMEYREYSLFLDDTPAPTNGNERSAMYRYIRLQLHRATGKIGLDLLRALFSALAAGKGIDDYFAPLMSPGNYSQLMARVKPEQVRRLSEIAAAVLQEYNLNKTGADAIKNVSQVRFAHAKPFAGGHTSQPFPDFMQRLIAAGTFSAEEMYEFKILLQTIQVMETRYTVDAEKAKKNSPDIERIAQDGDIRSALTMLGDHRRAGLDKLGSPVTADALEAGKQKDQYLKRHIAAEEFGFMNVGRAAKYSEPKFNGLLLDDSLTVYQNDLLRRMLNGPFASTVRDLDVEPTGSRLTALDKRGLESALSSLSLVLGALDQSGLASSRLNSINRILLEADISLSQLRDLLAILMDEHRNIVIRIGLTYGHTIHTLLLRTPRAKLREEYRALDPAQELDDDFFARKIEEKLKGDIIARHEILAIYRDALEMLIPAVEKLAAHSNEKIRESNRERPLTVYFSKKAASQKPAVLSPEMQIRVGGKGISLFQNGENGLPVPPGATLTTDFGEQLKGEDRQWLRSQLIPIISSIEELTGLRFPYDENRLSVEEEELLNRNRSSHLTPRTLLFAVRSGSFISEPGILETGLNAPMNDAIAAGMITRNEMSKRDVYMLYGGFLQQYGKVMYNIASEEFVQIESELKKDEGVAEFSLVGEAGMIRRVELFKELIRAQGDFSRAPAFTGEEDPLEIAANLVVAVFDSWNSEKAVQFRALTGISSDWGTAVNLQQMIYGDVGVGSGVVVAFSRDRETGERHLNGQFKALSMGTALVDGTTANVLPLSSSPGDSRNSLQRERPKVHARIRELVDQIDRASGEPVDVELAVHEGVPFVLQSRAAQLFTPNKSQIQLEGSEMLLDIGEGLSSGAVAGKILVADDLSFTEFREKARVLRAQLDASGQKHIGIIAVMEYVTSEEGLKVMLPEVSGAITPVAGNTAHAMLLGGKYNKVLLGSLSTLRKEDGQWYLGEGRIPLQEGVDGTTLTIDGNSRSSRVPTRGQVYLGELEVVPFLNGARLAYDDSEMPFIVPSLPVGRWTDQQATGTDQIEFEARIRTRENVKWVISLTKSMDRTKDTPTLSNVRVETSPKRGEVTFQMELPLNLTRERALRQIEEVMLEIDRNGLRLNSGREAETVIRNLFGARLSQNGLSRLVGLDGDTWTRVVYRYTGLEAVSLESLKPAILEAENQVRGEFRMEPYKIGELRTVTVATQPDMRSAERGAILFVIFDIATDPSESSTAGARLHTPVHLRPYGLPSVWAQFAKLRRDSQSPGERRASGAVVLSSGSYTLEIEMYQNGFNNITVKGTIRGPRGLEVTAHASRQGQAGNESASGLMSLIESSLKRSEGNGVLVDRSTWSSILAAAVGARLAETRTGQLNALSRSLQVFLVGVALASPQAVLAEGQMLPYSSAAGDTQAYWMQRSGNALQVNWPGGKEALDLASNDFRRPSEEEARNSESRREGVDGILDKMRQANAVPVAAEASDTGAAYAAVVDTDTLRDKSALAGYVVAAGSLAGRNAKIVFVGQNADMGARLARDLGVQGPERFTTDRAVLKGVPVVVLTEAGRLDVLRPQFEGARFAVFSSMVHNGQVNLFSMPNTARFTRMLGQRLMGPARDYYARWHGYNAADLTPNVFDVLTLGDRSLAEKFGIRPLGALLAEGARLAYTMARAIGEAA